MKIEKLKKLPNGKYKILFDNKEAVITYDDVIIKNNLLYKKEIDDELLNKLVVDNDYYSLYNKCINYINKRIRCEKEIITYLKKYTSDGKDIKLIVSNLKDIGLIDDIKFCKAFISDKINLSNMGPLKIAQELSNYDIPYEIINEEMSFIDNDMINEKIDRYISKKIKNNTKYSSYILKQKILNDLINDGYSKEIILEVLSNYEIKDTNLEKDYNSIYKKLSMKYSGYELEQKIKSKLYQKGYKIDEINNIIKEL